MKLMEAVETVLELARGNIIYPVIPDDVLEEQSKNQQEACDTVEDFFTNHGEEIEEKMLEITIPG